MVDALPKRPSGRLKGHGNFPEHDIVAPNKYLSNSMNRAVGARERLGGVTIPGAVPQADIKRAFGPKLTAMPQSLEDRRPPQPASHPLSITPLQAGSKCS